MLKQLIIGCCVLGLAQSAFAKMVVREITPPGTWTVKTQSSGDKTTFQIAIPFKNNVLPPGTSAQVDILDGTNPVSTLTPQLQVMDGKSCFVFTVPTKFLPNSKFSLTIIDVPHPSGDILWMNLGKLAEHQKQTTESVATSRTDPFLKLLRDGLDVKPATGWEPVSKAVDWDKLGQEAGKAADAIDRLATVIKRLAYVELWKRLAAAHDYGVTCSRTYVFEWLACELLAGAHKPDKNFPYADLGLGKAQACEYLLAEDLPAWATSLRSCAAAVLAGAGERRGTDALLEAVRATLKESRGFSPVYEAMRAAWTEEALPLWAEAARDPDPRVRLVVVQQVGAIRSGRAVPVLLAILKDEDRGVRTAAAMILMQRDVKADAKAPLEFAPVLMEKVRHELDGSIASAHENAPVCLKLQQWGVPDVPWEKIEAVLNDQARTNDKDYWLAVEIAGWCLGAGREKIALPFLKSTIDVGAEKLDQLATLGISGQKLAIPWHAATILASNGRTEGFDLIGRYIEVGQKNWIPAYEGLMALAAFLSRPAVAPGDRKLAMAIAAKAVERRDALFQGYFTRALEALGEMGALVRVEPRGPSLEAVEAIALPYDRRYGSSYPQYMMAEIFRAKVRSVSVAAQQDGITLPSAWLSEYQKQERAAITALAEGTNPDLRRAAEAALKDLAASPPAE